MALFWLAFLFVASLHLAYVIGRIYGEKKVAAMVEKVLKEIYDQRSRKH